MSAPSAASRTAWLRPCPRAAPVITATLSVNWGIGHSARRASAQLERPDVDLAPHGPRGAPSTSVTGPPLFGGAPRWSTAWVPPTDAVVVEPVEVGVLERAGRTGWPG